MNKTVGFILLLLTATAAALYGVTDLPNVQRLTLLITLLTASLWVTELLPIPVTSLLPLALLPLAGVLNPTEVAQAYGSPLIILLLGGFLLSTAMAHSNTHRYLANRIIHWVGSEQPARLLLSFMLAAFLLSMWISNTATTLMLVPIALAVTGNVGHPRFAMVLLLGIAYSASIGGTMTPIGTPPNLLMIQNYQNGTGIEIGFSQWLAMAAPIAGAFFPLMYWYMKSRLPKLHIDHHVQLDPLNRVQRRTLWVFFITAVLWMSRTAPYGGWKAWLDLPHANDASVALLAVVALFIIPNGRGERLLTWETANRIPWGMLLLFAGGIAIASAFKASGLSETIANQMVFLQGAPVWLMILLVCLSITFLTEITSNTATTAIMMPILMATAEALEVPPFTFMLPAAISASCAFMLPVATAPNAIVFAQGAVPIREMMRLGLVLNLIGAAVITAMSALVLL